MFKRSKAPPYPLPKGELKNKGVKGVVDINKNIILIGLSGTGKTTVGVRLAEMLNRPFFDLDEIIEREEGEDIPNIFALKGEKYFRDQESFKVKEFSRMLEGPAVISTGGGVVLREENIRHLQESGLIILLTASPEEIARRLGGAQDRPLLQNQDPQDALEKIRHMNEKRNPLYLKASDLKICTDNKTARQVAQELASLIQKEIQKKKGGRDAKPGAWEPGRSNSCD